VVHSSLSLSAAEICFGGIRVLKGVFNTIEKMRDEMIELQRLLTGIPAIAPDSEGEGEMEKAKALSAWLVKQGFVEPLWYNAPDLRVPAGERPNLVVTLKGERESPALWIMSHLDVVPPGEMDLWNSDPYTLVEKDGILFGRGVEDNQQGLVSSIFSTLALKRLGITPKRTVNLLFVADEEVGSKFGIEYLLKEEDLFQKGDLFLVPDGGRPDGTMIETAEKSVIWVKFTVTGKQCHTSVPELGVNANVAASSLIVALDGLKHVFPKKNPIFEPSVSTFVPSKREANVPNVNTLPGEDVFYLDCRILPEVPVDTVLGEIGKMIRQTQETYGVSVAYEVIERQESSATPADSPIVGMVKNAVQDVYHVEGKVTGIGGGTVSAHLRNEGYDTVVWSKFEENAHMPNEHCLVANMIGDAKVMAHLMLS
jgi:succinyl-diaminopimelate desuccinylase